MVPSENCHSTIREVSEYYHRTVRVLSENCWGTSEKCHCTIRELSGYHQGMSGYHQRTVSVPPENCHGTIRELSGYHQSTIPLTAQQVGQVGKLNHCVKSSIARFISFSCTRETYVLMTLSTDTSCFSALARSANEGTEILRHEEQWRSAASTWGRLWQQSAQNDV